MKRRIWVRLIGVGVLSALAGTACSPLPYPTAASKALQRALKPQASADGAASGVAVCYNEAFNAPKDVLYEARLLCEGGTVTYYDSDVLWTPCSLLQPSRASFICTPGQAAGAAASLVR